MREITEERILYLLKKYREFFIADIDKNLCLEHYNFLHKSNFIENDIKSNQTKCWFCKIKTDRP